MNALFEAAKEVCDFMKARHWEFCVIGGLAVQRWGELRTTLDADLTLFTGFGRTGTPNPRETPMAQMSKREQYRAYVEQWRRAGPELERIHAEELRRYRYDPADADTVLGLGDNYDGPPRETSGLVEMQRLFMKAARKQGLLPTVVRESPGDYASDGRRAVPARANEAGRRVYVVGDAAILERPKLALFCSVKCPGKLILETYDLAKRFRNEGVLVISPFHSPMEQECLRILLRSPHPVIWALARGIYRQIPSKPVDCRKAVTEDRLIMVTPFPETVRHITAETATTRNRLVAGMADAVVIAHAAPGSKMEDLCRDVLSTGKPLYTFDHPANAGILATGARRIEDLNLAQGRGRL